MEKSKEFNLKITEEQQELLQLALSSFYQTAKRIYKYDLNDDLYYEDLVSQVFKYSSNNIDKQYRPWNEEN